MEGEGKVGGGGEGKIGRKGARREGPVSLSGLHFIMWCDQFAVLVFNYNAHKMDPERNNGNHCFELKNK